MHSFFIYNLYILKGVDIQDKSPYRCLIVGNTFRALFYLESLIEDILNSINLKKKNSFPLKFKLERFECMYGFELKVFLGCGDLKINV